MTIGTTGTRPTPASELGRPMRCVEVCSAGVYKEDNMAVKDVYEFVAELGERFPDLTDDAVMLAVDEYEGNGGGYTNPRSPVGMILLEAYTGDLASAKRVSLMLFGFDLTKEKS